jgi:hypothetical protein
MERHVALAPEPQQGRAGQGGVKESDGRR